MPAHVEEAIAKCRYNPTVFVAAPWREIYVHDDEGRHSWATAVATYEVMVEAYTVYGYTLVELPQATVDERVEFLLARVGADC